MFSDKTGAARLQLMRQVSFIRNVVRIGKTFLEEEKKRTHCMALGEHRLLI